MLTSAKHGTGIQDAFKETAEMIENRGPIQMKKEDNNNGKSTLKLGKEQKTIHDNKCA